MEKFTRRRLLVLSQKGVQMKVEGISSLNISIIEPGWIEAKEREQEREQTKKEEAKTHKKLEKERTTRQVKQEQIQFGEMEREMTKEKERETYFTEPVKLPL